MDKTAADPLIGTTVAQYEVVARLGGGGMGIVYSARDTKLGRRVALKFLPPRWSHDESAKQRFIREAQAASATDHRNICTIHDIETAADGQLFIVMAHYDGQTLKQRLESGALPVDDAVEIAAQVAEGLAKAHAQGVIHRDIKPGNLILTEDGVKILDFGLAKLAAESLRLTLEGTTIGTVAYMSPEQARGDEADPRSDIWALGVVLYEMLAGQPPFRGHYAEAISHAIRHDAPLPLRAANPDIPEPLERLVFHALEKDLAARIQSARDMARDLRLLQGRTLPLDLRTEPLSAPQSHAGRAFTARRTGFWTRRKAIGVAAAVVALSVGAPLLFLWPGERIGVAVAPMANHTGEPELDVYRLALTEALIERLEESPALRVVPYIREVEILRRFMSGAGDVSSRDAIQAIATSSGVRFIVVPTLVYRDGTWLAQTEIRSVDTGTNVSTYETATITSSLPLDTASRLVASLSDGIQDHFKPRWSLRTSRPAVAPFATLEAARAFEIGLNNYEQMEYATALEAFQRVTREDPQRALAHAWVARVLLLMGQEREADAAAQRATQLAADTSGPAETALIEATLAETRRDATRAESAYRRLASLAPDDSSALFELADFLRRQFRNEEAIDAFHHVLELDPAYVRPRVWLTQLYTRRNEFPLAEQQAMETLNRYRAFGNKPGEAQALLYLAEIRRIQGGDRLAEAAQRVQEARAIFESAGGPYNLARAFQFAGTVAFSSRNYPAAIKAFEQALAGARQVGNRQLEGTVLMNLGVASNNIRQRRQALDYYGQSRNFYERTGDARRAAQQEVNIAGVLVKHGTDQADVQRRISNARATLRKLGDVDFDVVATQITAASYRYGGRHRDAIRELRSALNVASERQLGNWIPSLTVDIARSHVEMGEYQEAETLLEGILSNDSSKNDIEARIELGRVHTRVGRFDRAAPLLEAVRGEIDKQPLAQAAPAVYLALGELNYEAGKLGDALDSFARAATFWTADLPDAESIEARCDEELLTALGARGASNTQPLARQASENIQQARRMGHLSVEARCRIALARIEIGERHFQGAIDVLNDLPPDGERTLGPELRALVHYWRARALSARGAVTDAAAAMATARTLIAAVQGALQAAQRGSFAARSDIRDIH